MTVRFGARLSIFDGQPGVSRAGGVRDTGVVRSGARHAAKSRDWRARQSLHGATSLQLAHCTLEVALSARCARPPGRSSKWMPPRRLPDYSLRKISVPDRQFLLDLGWRAVNAPTKKLEITTACDSVFWYSSARLALWQTNCHIFRPTLLRVEDTMRTAREPALFEHIDVAGNLCVWSAPDGAHSAELEPELVRELSVIKPFTRFWLSPEEVWRLEDYCWET